MKYAVALLLFSLFSNAYGYSTYGLKADLVLVKKAERKLLLVRGGQAFREFKTIWDPDWKMNPGKVVDANPLDANLRVGPGRYPGDAARTFLVRDGTHFTFADDGGFANAARRCVGIGNCR